MMIRIWNNKLCGQEQCRRGCVQGVGGEPVIVRFGAVNVRQSRSRDA